MNKVKDILRTILTALKNSGGAILRGKLLLRLNVSRYFVHIIYVFFLFAMVIWVSLMIETTMTRVQRNAAALKELEIENTMKTCALVSLSRRSSVSSQLKNMGSKVGEPSRPASVLTK
ncbi:MAG: hypothetical protein J5871_04455 [Bacteroidales bacterium]|nr:hypothetical protein [Bacteroidales bacterium]